MKKIVKSGLILLATMIGMNCYAAGSLAPSQVPAKVQDKFQSMYPQAALDEWELNQGFYVAEFSAGDVESEAWFSQDGVWGMTETDYGEQMWKMPLPVQEAFNNTPYITWKVDDVKYYNCPDNFSFCRIDVERDGQPDTTIFFDKWGNIMNIVKTKDFGITPNTMIENLK